MKTLMCIYVSSNGKVHLRRTKNVYMYFVSKQNDQHTELNFNHSVRYEVLTATDITFKNWLEHWKMLK